MKRPAVPAIPIPFLVSSLLALSACAGGDSSEETRGTIAVVGGAVQIVAPEQEAQVCATTFCEPNYVYRSSFGKRRSDPPPLPPAPPPPVPIPTAAPTPVGEQDYSRKILRIPEAWELTQGSREIVVAVIDTGVAVDHPDLRNNIRVNEKERDGKPGVDNDGNGYIGDVYGYDFANGRPNAIDDNKHGTHCAGIIGAESNGFGSVGVNHRVRILPVKFLRADGSGDTASAIQAIDYAVANGAHVISNSWGGGGASELLNAAIQRAINRGVIVVAAAGNSSLNTDLRPNYPSSYPGVVAVGSTDELDRVSSFSNFGAQSVFVSAPGSNIFSTVPAGQYAVLSGTSMATPQVSGALALALSLRRDLAPSDLLSRLCASAKKINPGVSLCGRMDVRGFLESVRY